MAIAVVDAIPSIGNVHRGALASQLPKTPPPRPVVGFKFALKQEP